MPQVTDGGSVSQPLVAFHAVKPVAGTAATQVVAQTGTVEQAVEAAGVAIKPIPGAPAIANLPANAVPGQFYVFPSQPAVVYTLGFDFVWRAILLATVS